LHEDDVAHGKYIPATAALGWIREFCGQTQNKLVDMGTWLTLYLLWVLEHGSTNKVEGTGSFQVLYVNSSERANRTWESFFQAFNLWAGRTYGTRSTPRTLQRSLDAQLLETWNQDLPLLRTVKAQGTVRSQRVRAPDGGTIPAWAVVPDLFQSMRSGLDKDLVRTINSYVNLDENEGLYYSTALDQEAESLETAMHARALDTRQATLEATLQARRGKRGGE
jgi:hypothetical protein